MFVVAFRTRKTSALFGNDLIWYFQGKHFENTSFFLHAPPKLLRNKCPEVLPNKNSLIFFLMVDRMILDAYMLFKIKLYWEAELMVKSYKGVLKTMYSSVNILCTPLACKN